MSDESDIDLFEWEMASTKKMLSYSMGVLYSVSVGTGFSLVFYFFEVEIGLPVALLGIAFIIFAIWNMINDPLVAWLTDRPFKWTRKWGMRFPWIVTSVIPHIFFGFLLMLSPDADPSNPWPVFWWFVIIICISDTFFSIYTTHLNAGFTTYFRSDAERRRASAFTNFVPAILGLLWGLIGPLIIVYGDKQTFILSAFISMIIRIILVILLIPGIRESEDLKERFLRGYEISAQTESESYWKTMKKAFKRKNFTSTFLVFLFLSLAGSLYGASQIYFLKDILRLPFYYAIFFAIVGFIGFIIFIPFWVNMINKYGAAKIMKVSLILMAVTVIPVLWITTLEEALFFTFLGSMTTGAFTLSLGPVAADVYDECTISDGKHQEAMYEGIRTFFFRGSIIFQAIVFTIIHILTDYNPDPLAVQTPLAIWGLRIQMGLIPALLRILAFVIMVKWYDLEGEKKLAVKRQLRELRL